MAKAKGTKVPVSKAALLARINRKLAVQESQLMAARGGSLATAGAFFVVDKRNNQVRFDVDPIQLARELGVLKPYEQAEGFRRT